MRLWHLAALLVTSGFAAGVLQVLLLRELLLTCFGNEIALGLMLSAWLLAGALGAAFVGRRTTADSSRDLRAVLVAAALLLPASFVAILFARVYPLLACAVPMKLAQVFAHNARLERLFTVYLAAQPGEMLGPFHLVLVSFGTALLPSLLAGALFALGLRLYQSAAQSQAGASGRAYALDSVGHLLGGVLLGWVAVTVLSPFLVVSVACALLGACVLGLVLPTRVVHPGWLAALGLALIVGLAFSFPLQPWSSALRWQNREIVDEVSSIYGHVAVAKQGKEGVVFYENGTPTGLSPALPRVQEFVQFAMLQHLAPRRVLLIGGGATGGLQEVLKHRPEAVDYSELDPALLRFAERWVQGEDRKALGDPRVKVLTQDGRRVVKQAAAGLRARYDVILLMLPDPSTAMLNRFYTREWFGEARSALNPGGVLAWEMSSTRHYFGRSLLMMNTAILEATKPAFPRKAFMTGDDTLAVAVGDEKSALNDGYQVLARRLNQRHVRAPGFLSVARDRLDPYNKRYVLDELRKAPSSPPVNGDFEPVGYFYDQAMWIGLYYPDLEALYLRLSDLRLSRLGLPGVVLLGLLLLSGVTRRGRALYVPLSVFSTGALGMALELCLLFAFQAIYGYVYHQVGIITGAFMVGLAVGAWFAGGLAERLTGGRPRAAALVAAQLVLALLALAMSPVLRQMAGAPQAGMLADLLATCAFPILTALVGLSVGLQFPLAVASRVTSEAEQPTASSAAWLYAADLLGASLGAVLAGAVLVPVLGIAQTCLATATLAGAMALLLSVRLLKP